jgi:phosphate/sulfate permease
MGSVAMALGLLICGHRVLHTIGKKVMVLDYPKGFCVQFAASNAIMICEFMGIPVSSTHCNVGSLLGVSLAAGLNAVKNVYPETKVKKENQMNGNMMARIFIWWLLTVPLVFTATSLFTSTLT